MARHMEKHGGDVERSLAAIPGGPFHPREFGSSIDDPDVGETLADLGLGAPRPSAPIRR